MSKDTDGSVRSLHKDFKIEDSHLNLKDDTPPSSPTRKSGRLENNVLHRSEIEKIMKLHAQIQQEGEIIPLVVENGKSNFHFSGKSNLNYSRMDPNKVIPLKDNYHISKNLIDNFSRTNSVYSTRQLNKQRSNFKNSKHQSRNTATLRHTCSSQEIVDYFIRNCLTMVEMQFFNRKLPQWRKDNQLFNLFIQNSITYGGTRLQQKKSTLPFSYHFLELCDTLLHPDVLAHTEFRKIYVYAGISGKSIKAWTTAAVGQMMPNFSSKSNSKGKEKEEQKSSTNIFNKNRPPDTSRSILSMACNSSIKEVAAAFVQSFAELVPELVNEHRDDITSEASILAADVAQKTTSEYLESLSDGIKETFDSVSVFVMDFVEKLKTWVMNAVDGTWKFFEDGYEDCKAKFSVIFACLSMYFIDGKNELVAWYYKIAAGVALGISWLDLFSDDEDLADIFDLETMQCENFSASCEEETDEAEAQNFFTDQHGRSLAKVISTVAGMTFQFSGVDHNYARHISSVIQVIPDIGGLCGEAYRMIMFGVTNDPAYLGEHEEYLKMMELMDVLHTVFQDDRRHQKVLSDPTYVAFVKRLSLKVHEFSKGGLTKITNPKLKSLTIQFGQLVTKIADLSSRCINMESLSRQRRTPGYIVLQGKAGHGKSLATSILCKYLYYMERMLGNVKCEGDYTPLSTYSPPASSDYYEGYMNNLIVCKPEAFSTRDPTLNLKELSDILKQVSSENCPLDMAFGAKGSVYFDSEWMISSTNADVLSFDNAGLKDPNAFYRRILLPLTVVCSKRISDSDAVLRPEKLDTMWRFLGPMPAKNSPLLAYCKIVGEAQAAGMKIEAYSSCKLSFTFSQVIQLCTLYAKSCTSGNTHEEMIESAGADVCTDALSQIFSTNQVFSDISKNHYNKNEQKRGNYGFNSDILEPKDVKENDDKLNQWTNYLFSAEAQCKFDIVDPDLDSTTRCCPSELIRKFNFPEGGVEGFWCQYIGIYRCSIKDSSFYRTRMRFFYNLLHTLRPEEPDLLEGICKEPNFQKLVNAHLNQIFENYLEYVDVSEEAYSKYRTVFCQHLFIEPKEYGALFNEVLLKVGEKPFEHDPITDRTETSVPVWVFNILTTPHNSPSTTEILVSIAWLVSLVMFVVGVGSLLIATFYKLYNYLSCNENEDDDDTADPQGSNDPRKTTANRRHQTNQRNATRRLAKQVTKASKIKGDKTVGKGHMMNKSALSPSIKIAQNLRYITLYQNGQDVGSSQLLALGDAVYTTASHTFEVSSWDTFAITSYSDGDIGGRRLYSKDDIEIIPLSDNRDGVMIQFNLNSTKSTADPKLYKKLLQDEEELLSLIKYLDVFCMETALIKKNIVYSPTVMTRAKWVHNTELCVSVVVPPHTGKNESESPKTFSWTRNGYIRIEQGGGRAGDCGKPWIGVHQTTNEVYLLGVHFAKNGAGDAIAYPLYKKDIPDLQACGHSKLVPYLEKLVNYDKEGFVPVRGYDAVGKSTRFYQAKGGTEYIPSDLVSASFRTKRPFPFPVETAPVVRQDTYDKNGVFRSAFSKTDQGIRNADRPPLPPSVRKVMASDDYRPLYDGYWDGIPQLHSKFLTIEEAIFGCKYFHGMDTQASVGAFKWAFPALNKRELLWDKERKWIHPLLIEQVNKVRVMAENGTIPLFLVFRALKDETLPIDRVKAGKVRAFSSCDVVQNILLVMLYAVPSYYMKTDADSPTIGRYNPHGVDADIYYRTFPGKGGKMGLDGSFWDGSVNQAWSTIMARSYNEQFYGFEKDTKDYNFLLSMTRTVTDGIFVRGDNLYSPTSGHISGSNITTDLNNFINYCQYQVVWRSLYPQVPFRSKVIIKVGGDDVKLENLDPVNFPLFNMAVCARFLLEWFGIVCTNPDKTPITDMFSDEDPEFLSRNTDCVEGFIVHKLKISSIYGMLAWIRKDVENATQQNVDAACMEMIYYGRDEYSKFYRALTRFCRKTNTKLTVRPFNYWFSRFKLSYSRVSFHHNNFELGEPTNIYKRYD